MTSLNLVFDPQLPLWLAVLICALIAILCTYSILRNSRGSLLRAIVGILVCLALFNPSLLEENRTPLKNVVALIIDETTSQKIDNREEQTTNAVEMIRSKFAPLEEQFELREVRVNDRFSSTNEVSTSLFQSLQATLQDVPPEQYAGAIFITDGQVHDVPTNSSSIGNKVPLHVLLTGNDDERDRRITLKTAPRFGVVNENQELTYVVEQTGFSNSSDFVEVSIAIDGQVVAVEEAVVGEETSFFFDVPHGGKNIIELSVPVDDREITDTNNTTFMTINGIRENLRVLLVSGEPHAGERTWRNLLKSDASVDLVHFTILRPPEKQDGTPITELSLIAFPTQELFIQKIDEFDLIIFDRYKRRGILPALYFDNIARYVEDGGAILVASGPEYADHTSIGISPLQRVMPALADGSVFEKSFKPQITENGLRHPVTRGLDGWRKDEPQWGRWFRTIGVEKPAVDAVMADENDRPILMLQRHNEGRVALFLSDHVWLWSRGFEGGGPHGQLLRRVAHWLMKEPDLDEERLTATTNAEELIITRQTLLTNPDEVEVTSPTGKQETLKLNQSGDGLWEARLPLTEIGLYRISDGEHTTLAQAGPANPKELANVVSTPQLLRPITNATRGSISRISENKIPRVLSVSTTGSASGPGWIGLRDRKASTLDSVKRYPLFAGLLGFALLITAFALMWFREGR